MTLKEIRRSILEKRKMEAWFKKIIEDEHKIVVKLNILLVFAFAFSSFVF